MLSGVETPVHAVPGNHDISNVVQKSVWLERYGQTYGSVRYQDVLILLFDTEDPPVALPDEIIAKQNWLERNMQLDPVATQEKLLRSRRGKADSVKLPGSVAIGDEQLRWAEETLRQNEDVRWTLVVMHKPAWQYGHPGFLALEEKLKLRNYTVIAGHEHYFKHEKRFGQDYITMATCGGVWLNAHTITRSLTRRGAGRRRRNARCSNARLRPPRRAPRRSERCCCTARWCMNSRNRRWPGPDGAASA